MSNKFLENIRNYNSDLSFASMSAKLDPNLCWTVNKQNSGLPSTNLVIFQTTVKFTVDTASSANVMDEYTWSKIKHKPILNKSNMKLYAYACNKPIQIVGEFDT